MKYSWIVLSVFLAMVPAGWAASEAKPCEPEPTDQIIAYGDVLSGSDCAIGAIADVDFFNFTGLQNEVVRLVVTPFPYFPFSQAIRWEIYDPSNQLIDSQSGGSAITFEQQLTQSGTYRVLVFEDGNDETLSYDLLLERIFPFPAATPLPYSEELPDEINPIADLDPFVFPGVAGSRVRLLLTPFPYFPFSQGICLELYDPDGVQLIGNDGQRVCSGSNIMMDQDLAKTGDYLVLVSESGDDETLGYNLSLNCIFGDGCPPQIPCTLGVDLSYETGTFTMHFDLGVTAALAAETVTWKVFLSFFNTPFPAWQVVVPEIDPPSSFSVPFAGFPSLGGVGVLTTLTTPTKGIVCSDWETVDTGPIGPSSKELTPEQIRAILSRAKLRTPGKGRP